eukprot:162448_1
MKRANTNASDSSEPPHKKRRLNAVANDVERINGKQLMPDDIEEDPVAKDDKPPMMCEGQCQRMIIYMIYLIDPDTKPHAVAKFIDIVDVKDGAGEKELLLLIKDTMVTVNNELKRMNNDESDEKAADIILGNDPTKCTLSKTVWFGSDGASVMSKLAREMKKLNDILAWIHCIAHRGSLASKDPQKTKELKGIMDDIDKEVGEVQSMIKNSPKLKRNLNAYIATIENLVSKLHFKIRWLSKCEAYSNHLSNVPAIIKCFRKEHGEERDTKRRAKMKGTASKLQDFSRLQKKCIIADALEVIQPLKRQFQPDIMEFDRIEDILEDTYDDLDRLKTTQGTNEQRLMTQTIEIRKCESKEEEKRIENSEAME